MSTIPHNKQREKYKKIEPFLYSNPYCQSIMTSEEPGLTEFTPATLADTLKKIQQGEKTADEMERILNQMESRIETLMKDLADLESNTKNNTDGLDEK